MQGTEQKMAAEWEEEFDIEVEFPKFLGEVVDRTETIFENFDTEAAEKQAEVLDQTISLLRSMKRCCKLDTRDKEKLDFIAGALVDVLNVLCRRTISPYTVAADSGTIDREKGKHRRRPSLKIPVEMPEELRGLGIHFDKDCRNARSFEVDSSQTSSRVWFTGYEGL